jgi:hypothetical protein
MPKIPATRETEVRGSLRIGKLEAWATKEDP